MSSAHTYPVTKPHRIMTFTERARTEPPPSGFMRSVMRHHDTDDLDEGVMIWSQPERKITQEVQDAMDEKARKRAMKNLVNSWQERLQLISVITTFFATTEAAMLVNTKPVVGTTDWNNNVLQASNASLLGALILHVYAAVLSFLGAFLLIRYKLKEASREERVVEGKLVNSPVPEPVIKDVEWAPIDLEQHTFTGSDAQSTTQKSVKNGTTPAPAQHKKGSSPVEPPIISANPHIEQVGLFMSSVTSHLLSRTHTLCVLLAAIGFILAIAGILCYAWASQPPAVSVFVSACLGGSLLAMVVLFI